MSDVDFDLMVLIARTKYIGRTVETRFTIADTNGLDIKKGSKLIVSAIRVSESKVTFDVYDPLNANIEARNIIGDKINIIVPLKRKLL